MNKNAFYIFTAISFALLIAAPGRFAFGIVMCVEMFFILGIGFLSSLFVKKLQLDQMNSVYTVISLIFAAVLYKQIITLLFPLMALQLSFVFYLPAVSSYVIGLIYKNLDDESIKPSQHFKIVSFFSIFSLIFYAIRDIFGYGTFTLPSFSGLVEYQIFDVQSFSGLTLLASIPGSLVLVSISMLILIYIDSKFSIIDRTGDMNDSE